MTDATGSGKQAWDDASCAARPTRYGRAAPFDLETSRYIRGDWLFSFPIGTRLAATVLAANIVAFGLAAPANANSIADLQAANAELVAAIKAADAAGGSPPRATDPASAAKLAVAFDVTVLDQIADEDTIHMEVCSSALETLVGYLLFGAKREIDPNAAAEATASKIDAITTRNSMLYQDEVIPGLHFSFRCTASQLPAMAKFVEKRGPAGLDEARRKGVAQMRHGLVESLEGLISIQVQDYKPVHKQLVLDDLARSADIFIQSMGQGERDETARFVDAVLAYPKLTPAARTQIERISQSLKTAPCSALCRA